jgi:hypothetical protein
MKYWYNYPELCGPINSGPPIVFSITDTTSV